MALGLGELKIESHLNQPLKASVDLLNAGGLHQDEIKIRLATREDFEKLGLDRAYFLTSIKFDVIVDDSGAPSIEMTSEQPVLEPYLDFIVEARWPSGRLLREYTVLIDPPAFSNATPVVSASQRVEEVEGIPAPETKKKEGAEVTSGTAVDVKQSSLAPGAMPRRDFSADTSLTPQPGSKYLVHRDETLWEIANEARPSGVSVHQTMLDIQRLNPGAFINGNINRVKAGYIIYLPSAEDISSSDLSAALAEVKQQNEAWRAGRDAELAASAGPSLRISAEAEAADMAPPDLAAADTAAGADLAGDYTTGAPAATEADMPAVLEDDDSAARMVALEQQLETMQRIVSLKDEQIAALQSALAEADASVDAPEGEVAKGEAAEGDIADDAPVELIADDEIVEDETDAVVGDVEETTTPAPAVAMDIPDFEEEEEEESRAFGPSILPKDSDTGAGFFTFMLYLLGAAVLAVVGFLFWRNRSGKDEAQPRPAPTAPAEDVFSDVKLQDQVLEVEDAVAEEGAPAEEEDDVDRRGYGERRHDEYASDMEAADALAEADIYIAYGRHPQAIDLLNNALVNEPDNAIYRLKLLEIHRELNDAAAANTQLLKIREIGDADTVAQAEALMSESALERASPAAEAAAAAEEAPRDDGPGLPPNPLELMSDSGEDLEAEFAGLEIEGGQLAADEDELDLSADFEGGAAIGGDDEELVIAAESNGLSTKLDLARAYLDMGDEDGARQILEEVIAEGGDALKAEAQSLLDRIG
jgi:pilus assembly protein FimV